MMFQRICDGSFKRLVRVLRTIATIVTSVNTLTSDFLVWDGDCAFCARCVGFIERRVKTEAKIVAHQKADLLQLGLTTEQCNAALQWVFRDSTIRSGSRAVAALLRSSNFGWAILGVAIDLPVVRLISSAIYKLIAKNRQHLPGGTAACALDEHE
jgi:predicted DCC family thiol-disulfide oxidoreductase YuxK